MDDLDIENVAKPKAKVSRFAPKVKGKQLSQPVIPKPEPVDINLTPGPVDINLTPGPVDINLTPGPVDINLIPGPVDINLIPPISNSDPILKKCKIEKKIEINGEDDWMDFDLNIADMEIEEKEDDIVEEFDVFLNESPIEDGASLYVMQYPLRPTWHPYDLDEKCVEVRMKPKQSKLEVDLSLDIDSENYNREASIILKTQTLVSHMCTPKSCFAVGIRVGNQFHLSPVDSIMQFRPSVAKLIGEEEKVQLMNGKTKPSEGKAVAGSSSESVEDEPWVPLQYHPADSEFSHDYCKKMVAVNHTDIQFEATKSDYADYLCPSSRSHERSLGLRSPPLSMPLEERTKKMLHLMPLEERMKKWFSEGPQINRFVSLLYLAPDDSVEDVLKVLQQHACLVQGLWVTKSSLLCEGYEALARDYILSQFTKHHLIRYDKKRIPPDYARKILAKIAVQRSILQDWKFKENTDKSFIKSYPQIVEEQEKAWSDRVEHIMSSFRGAGKIRDKQQMSILISSLNPHLQKKTSDMKEDDNSQNVNKIDASADKPGLSKEELTKAIMDIFQLQGVWSLDSIVKELNGKISGPTPELQSVIKEFAVSINGKYVLKSRGSTIDPIRIILCKTFSGKPPDAKIKEQAIKDAIQKRLGRNVDSEFNQAVKELCIGTPGGGIQFRNGERVQK